MKKIAGLTLTVALVLVMALPALARPGRGWGGGGKGMGKGMGKMDCPFRMENLAPEQQEAMKALWDKHVAEVTPLREQMMAKEKEMMELMKAEQIDQAQAMELQSSISQLRAEMDQKRLSHLFEARTIDPTIPLRMGRHGMRGMGRHHRFGPMGPSPAGAPAEAPPAEAPPAE